MDCGRPAAVFLRLALPAVGPEESGFGFSRRIDVRSHGISHRSPTALVTIAPRSSVRVISQVLASAG